MTAVSKASVDEQMRVLMRGVEYGDPNIHSTMEQELRARLDEGRPLRVYAGFDPTSTDLTLGNLVPMLKLRQFQQFGHEVTFLIGTGTGIVGDPSGRSSARPMLTKEEVEANAETWLGQAFRVLDPKKTLVKRNGDWLEPLTLKEVVQLASNFTVAQFLDHDTFAERMRRHEPIHLHEFIYALLQGFDAIAMNTDVQIGGTDQLFNIMAGRTLQKGYGQRPQVAICTPLLIGTDGHLKMSKSVGNSVDLDDTAQDMYGKLMSVPDSLITNYYTLLTAIPAEEIAATEKTITDRTANPMEAKKRLAHEVVMLLNGKAAADGAQAEFERVFQKREEPERAQEMALDFGTARVLTVDITLLLAQSGLVPSRSEARRLLDQGALAIDGETVTMHQVEVHPSTLIHVGRHRFLRLIHGPPKP